VYKLVDENRVLLENITFRWFIKLTIFSGFQPPKLYTSVLAAILYTFITQTTPTP